MPQLDAHHDTVKNALIKDGWTITHDPLTIEFADATLFADLAAERPLAAQKGNEQIAVEVKMFGGRSVMSELQKASGQYEMYRVFLKQLGYEYELFLAVSEEAYTDVFLRPSVQVFRQALSIKLLVFDAQKEEIAQWIR